ncbi:MAG: porin, partial [Proteobacteria bacterium]|nr:porin [Pseudomonadota bacterium]
MAIEKRTALDDHGVSPASPRARMSAPAPFIGARSPIALAALCLAAFTCPSAQAASKPPQFLRSCTITPPDPAPVFSRPAAPKPAAASDDDDDDSEDDDEDDESPRGFVSPGTATCIAVSGTVNVGVQHDSYRASDFARMIGLVPQNALSSPLSTTFRIETGQMLAEGRYLATAFEFSVDATSESSELTMSEASVTFGAFAFGLASSRFDFWTGDDFTFLGRIPNRTVALIGYERQLTDEFGLSLSLEDVDADRRTVVPPTGKRLPDGVVRLLYEQDGLTLHGGVAVRDVQGASGSYRVGRAAILGATWER